MHRTLFILWLILLSSCTAVDDSHAVEDTVFNPQLSDALQKALEKVKGILNSENISPASISAIGVTGKVQLELPSKIPTFRLIPI